MRNECYLVPVVSMLRDSYIRAVKYIILREGVAHKGEGSAQVCAQGMVGVSGGLGWGWILLL
jgi:hypothetical protein